MSVSQIPCAIACLPVSVGHELRLLERQPAGPAAQQDTCLGMIPMLLPPHIHYQHQL